MASKEIGIAATILGFAYLTVRLIIDHINGEVITSTINSVNINGFAGQIASLISLTLAIGEIFALFHFAAKIRI